MTSRTKTSGDEHDDVSVRDERLAEVLDRLINDSQRYSSAELLDQAVRDNPDLEADIRELYATAMIAADVAMLQSDELSHIMGAETHGAVATTASPSPVGTKIGEYELREEIGRGGMGVVYRAYQQSLDRTVALKMIPNAAFAASQDLARLRAEALARGAAEPSEYRACL